MKHNLAKVLGLEEYNEEPNIRVEPTEDEVIQIEQDKFVQEMADHSEATTEALEAIGNAQALASVIARNDSTDKTTYELLKVAVEQLKEKTGVKTESVSLESLDKTSYKTEGLQDIKKTVVAIWEAIKKAFFSLIDKVKNFLKTMFGQNKKTEEKLDQAEEECKEFTEEIKDVPKSPSDSKEYKGDYFTKPTTETATTKVRSAKQAQVKTQVETPPEPVKKTYDFKFSDRVASRIGTSRARNFTASNVVDSLRSQYKELENVVDKIIGLKLDYVAQEFSSASKGYSETDSPAFPSHVSYFADAKIDGIIAGKLGPSVTIFLNSKDTESNDSVKLSWGVVEKRYVRPINPELMEREIFDVLKNMAKLTRKLDDNSKRYAESMGKFFKEQEAIYNGINYDDPKAQRKIEVVKSRLNEFKNAISNLLNVVVKLNQYINGFLDAFSDYNKENLKFFKTLIDEKLSTVGYVSEKDYDEYIDQFKFD